MRSIGVTAFLLLAVLVVLSEQAKLSRRYNAMFEDAVKVSTVGSNELNEASGLCASRIHPNILYTHNDSGDSSHSIFAIDANTGQQVSKITINGAWNQDWEDIACGVCADNHAEHCIYVADTGGNVQSARNTIYRIKEPAHLDSHVYVNIESTMKFSWDQHDCETLMVAANGAIYVVSKVQNGRGKLVHISSRAWGTGQHLYLPASEGVYLNIHTNSYDPVGGDISPNGKEVLIKTYGAIYYYQVPDFDYYRHMSGHPQTVPYHPEHQGEAVAWKSDGMGYYTLSEGSHEPIYYYRRRSSSSIVG